MTRRISRFIAGDDVPPPGLGFTTVTGNNPGLANWPAGTTALSSVDVAEVGVREAAPTVTVDSGMKPVPVILNVVSGLPKLTILGEMEVTTGIGLLTVSVKF